MPEKLYDAIIVGGGPAGLTCALILGRSKRKVLVFDTGSPRNRSSLALRGFPTRDGENPLLFLKTLRKEVSSYGVEMKSKEIVDVKFKGAYIEAASITGKVFLCRKLLLATGVKQELPPLTGAEKFFGKGLYHCPYCDGWEAREGKWFVYAENPKVATEICLRFKTWTEDIFLLGAYTKELNLSQLRILKKNGINIVKVPVTELIGRKNAIQKIKFEDGSIQKCDALFFSSPPVQHSQLAAKLGCRVSHADSVDCSMHQRTNVPGVFVAGDMTRDMQLSVIAAAEGAKAAVVINTELNREDRTR